VNFIVCPSIPAVHIGNYTWIDHRVIHGNEEDLLLIFRDTLDLD